MAVAIKHLSRCCDKSIDQITSAEWWLISDLRAWDKAERPVSHTWRYGWAGARPKYKTLSAWHHHTMQQQQAPSNTASTYKHNLKCELRCDTAPTVRPIHPQHAVLNLYIYIIRAVTHPKAYHESCSTYKGWIRRGAQTHFYRQEFYWGAAGREGWNSSLFI